MKRDIGNRILRVTVMDHGAELCSIIDANGVEYIWQGDPAIWGRHAPILFPVVGRLAGDRYIHDGISYNMKQHGFARDMDFVFKEETAESLSFLLLPSAETRIRYPFEFSLQVTYLLRGNTLDIRYDVENKGRETMPFSIGAHPAFALTWGKEDSIEDYFVEFEEKETIDTCILGGGNLISGERSRALTNENRIPIRRETFDRDALIFLNLKSRSVSLLSQRHGKRLTVEFDGFPYLGIWAKPAATFVCIEPWLGHADMEGADGVLLNKPGIIKLEPGGNFSCTHRIVIEDAK